MVFIMSVADWISNSIIKLPAGNLTQQSLLLRYYAQVYTYLVIHLRNNTLHDCNKYSYSLQYYKVLLIGQFMINSKLLVIVF